MRRVGTARPAAVGPRAICSGRVSGEQLSGARGDGEVFQPWCSGDERMIRRGRGRGRGRRFSQVPGSSDGSDAARAGLILGVLGGTGGMHVGC
jgi:hypothetical protein